MQQTIRLGLIGDNIAASQSPRLHRLAGLQNGRSVTYDRLVPLEHGKDFDALFSHVATSGYRGVNVTYPYKERVVRKVRIDDPLVRAIGAVNTVTFDEDGPRGYNTDHSGFVAAYRHIRSNEATGTVCLIGAGGVGKAVAFGLLALGATDIRIVDRDLPRAQALATALRALSPRLKTEVGADAADWARGATGLINCTPIGMVGHGGTPLPLSTMAGSEWVFDAVYTPVDTPFLQDAAAEGLTVISGYELFIGQGADAWTIFTGLPLDQDRLRADLLQPE
ncbi:shikimate dehydrogenase [Cereibacter changlensis JA139]|uniref:shikimate dehydrogenase (NADP(+)) n=2 Tax=Cereibacter changlensis TaxID=402884 RepID=A0A2T4JZM7_9RHOB|nr:shikimate dehydrogenase [Cereibacter changlensis]PTE23358.1 shikimate dehydrogenase [Cereibacter changlensis JA139]